mgnify:FL=1
MLPLTEDQVRAALVNASPEERERLAVPLSFVLADWDHLDFLAWPDPDNRGRGYLVVERDGDPTGIVPRAASGGRSRAALCNLCHTMQPGNQVVLFTARRAGDAGERGDSVGTYACADLGCHENVRLAPPLAPSEVRTSVDRRIDGTRARVEAFVERVLA